MKMLPTAFDRPKDSVARSRTALCPYPVCSNMGSESAAASSTGKDGGGWDDVLRMDVPTARDLRWRGLVRRLLWLLITRPYWSQLGTFLKQFKHLK